VITKQQKEEAFVASSQGRGGIFLDATQRRVLVEVTAKHYDRAVFNGKPFTKKDIVERVKSDPEVKEFLPFILLTILGAVISWVIQKILDSWWNEEK
jgi:hypothetical protein